MLSGFVSHSEPAECCYRAPWDWLLHECLLKIKECNCERRDLASLTHKVWSPYLPPSFSACLCCVIEHRHACVCVFHRQPHPFFSTMSSWSCRGVLGLTDRPDNDCERESFSPGSHYQWASVFVCLVFRLFCTRTCCTQASAFKWEQTKLGRQALEGSTRETQERRSPSPSQMGSSKPDSVSLSAACAQAFCVQKGTGRAN